jgi:hypothetical protein
MLKLLDLCGAVRRYRRKTDSCKTDRCRAA